MLLLTLLLACDAHVYTLDDGVYLVGGNNNATRSLETFGSVSLRDAQWTFRDQGDGTWAIQAYDDVGTWVWGHEGFAPEEDGVFRIELENAPSCGELPSHHEIEVDPRGPDRFVGIWDLWQQSAHCDDAGCVCTGDTVERAWALDLNGSWAREIPEGF